VLVSGKYGSIVQGEKQVHGEMRGRRKKVFGWIVVYRLLNVQVGGDVKMSLDLDQAIQEDQLQEQAEVLPPPSSSLYI
jgi:hypothetical protein